MAERGGLAPHAATRGTNGLANHAHALVRFTFLEMALPAGFAPAASAFARRCSFLLSFGSLNGPPGRICTRTGPLLRRLSLLLDYRGKKGLVFPAGLAPAASAFEARRSCLLSYGNTV